MRSMDKPQCPFIMCCKLKQALRFEMLDRKLPLTPEMTSVRDIFQTAVRGVKLLSKLHEPPTSSYCRSNTEIPMLYKYRFTPEHLSLFEPRSVPEDKGLSAKRHWK